MAKNAKKELLKKIPNEVSIKCAKIVINYNYAHNKGGEIVTITLRVNHTKKELKAFLNELNFKYDNPYRGRHAIEGTVWLDDESWIQRDYEDCVEFWTRYKKPQIN